MTSAPLQLLMMKTATLICWLVSTTVWNQMLLTTGCRGMQTTTPTASESINDNNLTATFDFIPQSNNDLTRPSVVTVDFEKPLTDVDLLALKVDKSLMTSLDQWLGKYGIQLPNSLIKTIEQMDLCPEKASEGMRHYCTKMPNGRYYDPWNPWCGYIVCLDGRASRQVCQPGSWMGTAAVDIVSGTMDTMCRRKLESRFVCSEQTDQINLCRTVTLDN